MPTNTQPASPAVVRRLTEKVAARVAMVTRGQNHDSGITAVMVALLAATLAGMAAFAVDIGYAYSVKRQLSVTADASALAGAQAAAIEFSKQRAGGGTCDATELQVPAKTAAIATHNENGPAGSDGDPTVTVTCSSSGDLPVINVEVNNRSTLPTFFGQLWGVENYRPPGRAVAQISGSQAYYGLRPYAVCVLEIADEDDADFDPNRTYQSVYDNGDDDSPCNFSPAGNWGLVNFNDSQSTASVGETTEWTQNGYPGAVTIPDPDMDGDPGASFNTSPQIQSALTSIVGKTVLLPVASSWDKEETGANANFNAVGVLSARICGWRVKNKGYTDIEAGIPEPCWREELTDTTADPGIPGDEVIATNFQGLLLQWRIDYYAPSYESTGSETASDCDLDDITCLPAIRLWE